MSNHASHINNTFKIDFSSTDIIIPNNSGSHLDLYSHSGIGYFHGFALMFSDEKIILRLEVDGNEVFEIDLKDLKDMIKKPNEDFPLPFINYSEKRDTAMLDLKHPILFKENVRIQAKANDNNNGRKLETSLVYINKES